MVSRIFSLNQILAAISPELYHRNQELFIKQCSKTSFKAQFKTRNTHNSANLPAKSCGFAEMAARAAQQLARLALTRGNAPGRNLMLIAAGALLGFAAAEVISKEDAERRKKAKPTEVVEQRPVPPAISSPVAVVASAGDQVPPVDLAGLVGGSSPSKVFIRASEHFAAEFDAATRTPRWVVERLTRDNVGGEAERATAFKEEPGLPPSLRARLTDYSGWRYDRGHMAPAANHRNSAVAMGDTFYLSNIAPQVGTGFNRDYWARLEKMVRDVARMPASKLPHNLRQALHGHGISSSGESSSADAAAAVPAFDAVYVATGPLFLPEWDEDHDSTRPITDASSSSPSSSSSSSPANHAAVPARPPGRWVYRHEAIGDAGHWVAVPSHFYKVVCAVARDGDGDGGAANVAGNSSGGGSGGSSTANSHWLSRLPSWLRSPFCSGSGSTSSRSAPSAASDAGRAVAVAAFLMPNAPIPADTPLERFIVPLSVVEGAAGLQFFRGLLPPAGEPAAMLRPASNGSSSGGSAAGPAAVVGAVPGLQLPLKAVVGSSGAEAATALQQAGVDAGALTVMLAEAAWTAAPAAVSATPQAAAPPVEAAAESPKRGRGRPPKQQPAAPSSPSAAASSLAADDSPASTTAGLSLLRENTARLIARGYPGPISRDVAPQLAISAEGEGGTALVPAKAAASAAACLRVRHLCSIEDACRLPAENWFAAKKQPADQPAAAPLA